MWLSRGEFDALVHRVEKIESQTRMGITDRCGPDGEVVYAKSGDYGFSKPLNEVVAGLAEAIGLRVRYKPEETNYVATKRPNR